jgi:MHS family proline/betaine transporter-like MFS transporter
MKTALSSRAKVTKSIVAAVIGNALEWFDLVVYGIFAQVIADLFFPSRDPSVSLLYALGTFGISFIVRPIGAVVVGRFADRSGRRAALVLVTTLMLLGTAIIAALPTYEQIGVSAPALLLMARLIQGFSAGGEFGSATAYLAEQNPGRCGFYSSWQFASQGLAMLLASGMGLVLSLAIDKQQLYAWGWRLPFVVGLLIGPVAYFIRQHADETPEFELACTRTLGPSSGRPLPRWNHVAVGAGAVVVATVALYMTLYLPTFTKSVLGLPAAAGYAATVTAGIMLVLIPPLTGALSDRIGRIQIALPAAIVVGLLPIPLFAWLIGEPSAMRVVLVQLALASAVGCYLGVLPAYLSELFPVESRTTGLSLSYNLSVVVAGGFAPMLFAVLVRVTGNPAAPSFYLSFAAAISAVALVIGRRFRPAPSHEMVH